MYTLRQAREDETEINTYLGKEYVFIYHEFPSFKKEFNRFCQSPRSKGHIIENIIGLILPEDKREWIPVYVNERNCILNPVGEIFCDINYVER